MVENFWQRGPVVYQIYPRSFKDGNADGQGDLRGITEQLAYLNGADSNSLGIDAIWISPFYPSPMADGGYDISDYTNVDPRFGNIDDFKELVAAAHKRNIKVVVDFVPNHTSDEHPWFQQSRLSDAENNPKRDWYIWRDGKSDGSPPNNWLSVFPHREYNKATAGYLLTAQSAWTYDEARGQFYLHSFSVKQPDLNWANPEVRAAMKEAMRFWLNLGVDGFRVDVADHLGKHPNFPDELPNPSYAKGTDNPDWILQRHHSKSHPSLFGYLIEMTDTLAEYEEKFMVVEVHVDRKSTLDGYLQYYQHVNPALCMPFNFEGLKLPWTAQAQQEFLDHYLLAMQPGYVPNHVLGNHDVSRVASRIGRPAARSAALMQLALPGMVYIYYGEECGMEDVPIPPDLVQDPYDGRDPERTPMVWSADTNAGFTTADKTWLPVSPDYPKLNVQAQLADPQSFLSLYKALIEVRKTSDALRFGTYTPLHTKEPDILGFTREHNNERFLVLISFSSKTVSVDVSRRQNHGARIIISSGMDRNGQTVMLDKLNLRAYEGLLIRLKATGDEA